MPCAIGRFAPHFTGDRRSGPAEATSNLLYGMALHPKKGDLFALHQGQVAPQCGFAENLNIAGGMPPAFRNNLAPTGCEIPAAIAASSLVIPREIPSQKR